MHHNMFDYKKWLEFYTNPEEMQLWQELATKYNSHYWEDYGSKWDKMFKKVEQHLSIDPKGTEAHELFKEWMELVNTVYADYPKLKKRALDVFKSGLLFQMKYYNQAVVDFIDKIAKYTERA